MADGKKEEMKLPSIDELFTTQEERDDAKLKRIHEIPLSEIDPFPDHPFKVRDDEDMDNLVESIRAKGMITPCMVRRKKDGRYELVSGHRRMRACEILGMDKLRCEIADLSRDEATILMVESNFQRSKILPSEKAFAYKMRLDAMKMLVSRMRENQRMGRNFGGAPVEPQLAKASEHLAREYVGTPGEKKNSGTIVANQFNESRRQIYRYIRLTELIPELLELVDEGKIGLRPAVELSYLESKQRDVYAMIEREQCTPTHEQARRMRTLYQEGKLTNEVIEVIMTEEKPNQKERIVLRGERIRKLFPPDLPVSRREDYVAAAMEHYARHCQKVRDKSDAR